jgi:hypothetical protein
MRAEALCDNGYGFGGCRYRGFGHICYLPNDGS